MLGRIKNPSKKLFLRKKLRNRYAIKTANKSCKPRLTVFKSNKHIYAQLIDDSTGRTLVAASTKDKDYKSKTHNLCNIVGAEYVGQKLAERATNEAKINEVVFDRGAYIFHGKIKALADKARDNGLKF